MRLPIDTTSLTFIAVNPPAPLLDHDTKAPKLDADNRPVFTVGVVALGADGADVLVVKVSGEPKGITQACLVSVTGLVATTWQMGDRHGVSFKADAITTLGIPAAPSAAGKPSS